MPQQFNQAPRFSINPSDLGQIFQVRNVNYILIDDPTRLLPAGMPIPINPDAIRGIIPSTIFIANWIFRVLIKGGCGCPLTVDRAETQFLRWKTSSYTGQNVCKVHKRVCEGEKCARTICISGNADGFRFDMGDTKAWLCADCFDFWKNKYKWQKFWHDFSRNFLK